MTVALGADPEAAERFKQALPILCPLHMRMVKAEDLAGIISFLCSQAAGDLTGINIPVDQVRARFAHSGVQAQDCCKCAEC